MASGTRRVWRQTTADLLRWAKADKVVIGSGSGDFNPVGDSCFYAINDEIAMQAGHGSVFFLYGGT